MPSGPQNLFLILATGEFLMGILGNGFIGLVNCIDWVKSRKISSVDCILTCLAITRISYLWIILLYSFAVVLWPHLHDIRKTLRFISFFWTLTNHLATWFATCLSVFYFLKIPNFSHPCLIWLKWRINKVLLVLLLGSSFILFYNLLSIGSFHGLWNNVTFRDERNLAWSSDVSKILYCNSLISFNITYLIPFLLSLISLLLLYLSLKRHTKNLQLNSMGSKDLSTEAHKRAMKMVMSFLLLFIVHCLSTHIVGWIYLTSQKDEASLFIMLIITVFPSGHSFLLIWENRKLRQTALRLLRHLKGHMKRAKPLSS
ncbi:taste receptor type 2 member 42 [Choloepus didactylus]|uniref:taste receptor type 2 member 42 n=1 Tax=Choloepus didactylus TaxID=27675 RepID=UPI00189DBDC5|nr:taste receptor type 2 member 42 [Choloepus didactylus]